MQRLAQRLLGLFTVTAVATSSISILTPSTAHADPHYARYADGTVITFSKWDTGAIGSTAAFTAVWIAAATLSGQGGNRLYHNIWYIQTIAAYGGATGRCLWVWLPLNPSRGVEAGTFAC